MHSLNKKLFSVWPVIFFALISSTIFVFYLYYVNFSVDTILLFLSNKIYLGKWLAKGIFPLYNHQIFAGIPFAFDVGLGNFHPFNLFFLLPYPLSFASWMGLTTFLFLCGYFSFFLTISKNRKMSVLLTLMLLLSGSGFWRSNNPTIFLVIAHFGFFMSSVIKLEKKAFSWEFIVWGFFLTISGHIQFVFYGYILAFLTGLIFFKLSFKRIVFNFFMLFIATSWYYLLSAPIALTSTRISDSSVYLKMGYLQIAQVIQLILPLYLGYIHNGSHWNVGYTYVVLISVLFLPVLGYLWVKRRVKIVESLVLVVLTGAALGLINFPFFRAPSQTLVLIHIWGLAIIARNKDGIVQFFKLLTIKKIALVGLLVSICIGIFFYSHLFSIFFLTVYKIVKHGKVNLFFDIETIQAVGRLIGINFVIYSGLFLIALLPSKKLSLINKLFLFILFEGLLVNYLHNYFIPQKYVTKTYGLPKIIDTTNYRVQTGADVVPYFGFHTYMANILLRPPFSKEPSIIDAKEEVERTKLSWYMSYFPSTWSMTYGVNSIQAYNTFVPKKISAYFKKSSNDYEQVYDYIIKRNSLYGQSEIGLNINGIETSRITLYDPRWSELGVKYFISNSPLKNYKLIYKDSRYFYENPKTPPIYRIQGKNNNWVVAKPKSINPNEIIFSVGPNDIGKKLALIINSSGFVAKQNSYNLPVIVKNFSLEIPIKEAGQIQVYYSPIEHFIETMTTIFGRHLLP